MSSGQFLTDDWILLNRLREGGSLGVWATQGETLFRPVSSAAMWLIDRLFNGSPRSFHVINSVLVLACSWLVYLIVKRLLESKPETHDAASTVGLLSASFFLVNPTHTEVVNWACCLNLTLSLALGLAGLFVFILWLEKGGHWMFAGGFLLIGSAMLARESSFAFPLIAFAISLFFGSKGWKLALTALSAASLCVAYCALRSNILGPMAMPDAQFSRFEFKNSIVVSLNNSLLPFGRWLDIVEPKLPSLTLLVLLVTPLVVIARRWPRTPGKHDSLLGWLAIGWLLARLANAIWLQVLGNWFDGTLYFVVAGSLILLLNHRDELWRKHDILFVAFLAIMLYTYWHERRVEHWILLIFELVGFAYLSRKEGDRDVPAREMRVLSLGFLAMVSVVLLSAPTLASGMMRWWGIELRYSFEPSVFGAVVAACASAIVVRNGLAIKSIAAAYLALAAFLFVQENRIWRDAYDSALVLAERFQALDQQGVRRVYLMTAPYLSFKNGIEEFPKFLNLKLDAVVAFSDFGHVAQEPHRVEREGEWLRVTGNHSFADGYVMPHFLFKQAGSSERFFDHHKSPGMVRLKDFDPRRDVVATFDGKSLEWIDGRRP